MSCSQPRLISSKVNRSHPAVGLRDLWLAVCPLLAALVVLPSDARAQQWVFSPEVEIGVQHVDNPRLEEDGPTENITGGLLDIAGAIHRNTETSSVLIRPAAALYRYSGDSDEDSEAYFLDFDAEKQGQRSNWRFRGNYRQQQVFRGETTSTEIEDAGIEDSIQTGTGRTFERRQRDMWRLGPGFTLDFTERTALQLDFNYLDVQYDSQELGEAVDYKDSQLDVSIVRDLSEDSRFEFGVFASKYEPDAAFRDTDSTGVRVRYEKEVSEISTFFVDLGAQDSEIESIADPEGKISETSFLWNVGYSRQWERTRWRFDVGQAVTPSGSGSMVERDLYRAIMQHQLQPRWSLLLSAVAMNTDTLGGENLLTNNNRDYLQGRASLAWQMTRNWVVEGRYGLTHQDFADIEGDAQENEFRLSLVYRPPIPTQ